MAPRRSQWGRYPRVRTVVSASPGCATSLIAFFSSGNAVLPGRPGWKPGVQTMARLEAGGTDDGPAGSRGTNDGPAGSRGDRRRPGWRPGGQTTARLEAGGTNSGPCVPPASSRAVPLLPHPHLRAFGRVVAQNIDHLDQHRIRPRLLVGVRRELLKLRV